MVAQCQIRLDRLCSQNHEKLLKCCPKTQKVATKTSKVATLIYKYFIQILLKSSIIVRFG